jgi:hypothetical protein
MAAGPIQETPARANSLAGFSAQSSSDIPRFVSHEGNHPLEINEYLRAAGIQAEVIARSFSPDGSWQHPASALRGIYEPSQSVVDRVLNETATLYTMAQASLAHINRFGYNDHGPNHIARVTDNAGKIASTAGLSSLDTHLARLAGVFHDLGNLFSRDEHSVISPAMAVRMYSELATNPDLWRRLENAIVLHNSAQYRPYLRTIAHLSEPERLEALKQDFGVVGLCLLIGDKVDVGRGRVNDKALTPEAFSQHGASHYNMFLNSAGLPAFSAPGVMTWRVEFNSRLSSTERVERFSGLAVSGAAEPLGASDVYLPDDFTKALVQGASVMDTAVAKFWRLGGCGSMRAIECAMALFDGTQGAERVERFDVVFVDPIAGDSARREFSFRRDRFLSDFTEIDRAFPRTSTKGF